MSQVLIESEGVRKQITGGLVERDRLDDITGYCALGALACEAQMPNIDNHHRNLI